MENIIIISSNIFYQQDTLRDVQKHASTEEQDGSGEHCPSGNQQPFHETNALAHVQ